MNQLAPTRRLASFAAQLSYADLPPAVADMARCCLLDWLGIAIAGSSEPVSPILRKLIEQLGGHPQATVVGLGTRTSVANAAMLNGTFAHSLDFDDVHQDSGIHGSAPVWAATLAVAEWRGAGGEEATAAFVAGYEVMAGIGLAVDAPMIRSNFHPTGVLGYYGCAAAAGRLLGMPEEGIARAFGVAAGQAGGLSMVRGTMSKPFFAGHSAQGGVVSALMAWDGFESVTDAIEGAEGVLATFGRSPDSEEVLRRLGSQYELPNTSFKIHSCCSLTHAMVDGLLEIRREAATDPSQIDRIRVDMYPPGFDYVDRAEVPTGLAGKFSGQYCAALALLDGQLLEPQFTDERSRDPAVRSLMERVALAPVEGLSATQAECEVRLRDGRAFRRRVDGVKGSRRKPISWEDLAGKFERLAGATLPPAQVGRLLDLVADWPRVEVRELLAATGRGADSE